MQEAVSENINISIQIQVYEDMWRLHSVCEEQFSAGMNFDVVQRIELATVIIIQQHGSIMRRGWVYKCYVWRPIPAPGVNE